MRFWLWLPLAHGWPVCRPTLHGDRDGFVDDFFGYRGCGRACAGCDSYRRRSGWLRIIIIAAALIGRIAIATLGVATVLISSAIGVTTVGIAIDRVSAALKAALIIVSTVIRAVTAARTRIIITRQLFTAFGDSFLCHCSGNTAQTRAEVLSAKLVTATGNLVASDCADNRTDGCTGHAVALQATLITFIATRG